MKKSGPKHDTTRYADYLAMFLIRTQELQEKHYYRILSTINPKTPGDAQQLPLLDEELLISFLATYRQFFLGESVVNLDFIRKVCRNVAKDHLDRDWLRILGTLSSNGRIPFRIQFKVAVPGTQPTQYTDEQIVKILLNSKFFHADQAGLLIAHGLRDAQYKSLLHSVQYYLLKSSDYVIAHQPLALEIWSSDLVPRGNFVNIG